MKKLLIISFSLLCLNAIAQKKDTTIQRIDTTFAVLLSRPEYEWFISILKAADEKPTVISQWINSIALKTRIASIDTIPKPVTAIKKPKVK